MIPVPHDPSALPYSDKSDPLRGPIYIPLNANCLQKDDQLFKGEDICELYSFKKKKTEVQQIFQIVSDSYYFSISIKEDLCFTFRIALFSNVKHLKYIQFISDSCFLLTKGAIIKNLYDWEDFDFWTEM